MLITLLRRLVRSYISLEFCQSHGVPTQHVEDIPLLSSASFGVCSTGLAGYSCLSVEAIERVQKRALNIIYPEAES